MTTNLRLLFDECITDPLARLLRDSSSALNIEYVRELPSLATKDDHDVMAYAKKENRIVVTVETGINHKKFKLCTHPGIIVLCKKRHESIHGKIFEKFLLSGHRVKANHAVVFLSDGQARIKTKDCADEIIPL